MPVSKNKRSKKTASRSGTRTIKPPKLLEKLPCAESAVQKIAQGNNAALMRFYFGTADQHDADYLYTHLTVSWILAERMTDVRGIRLELLQGVLLLMRFYKNGKLERDEIDALRGILDFSLDLWRKSTVEEVVQLSRDFRDGKIKVNFKIDS